MKTPTKRTAKKNILRVWNACTDEDKRHWYMEAHEYAKSLVSEGINVSQVAGIIAALSPLKKWELNKRIAALLIQQNETKGLHTALQTQKALRIKEMSLVDDESICEILKGEKIKAFYMNIRHPECVKNITIDRHALSIAHGRKLTDDKMQMTPKQYAFYKKVYEEVAKDLNISPVLLQSATWERWRKPQFQLL